MKQIILGVFTDQYHLMSEKYGWMQYPFYDIISSYGPYVDDVVEMAVLAAKVCDKVNFLLDGIYFPLSDKSISCRELKKIMMDEDLLGKTRFWYKGSRVKNGFIEYLIGTDAKGEAGKLINALYKNNRYLSDIPELKVN